MAIIGAPNITQTKSFAGTYQYPSRNEKEASSTKQISTESINNKTSFLLSRDKLMSLFNKTFKSVLMNYFKVNKNICQKFDSLRIKVFFAHINFYKYSDNRLTI